MKRTGCTVRRILTALLMTAVIFSGTVQCFADVWEFGTSGKGRNPFTPRGYLVDTDNGQHWLSNMYNNSGSVIRYSGVRNGVDYLEAKKSDGSNYTFYAMTDRNPYTSKKDWIAYGKKYMFAYKDGVRISNFTDYIQTPARRGDKVDPSGNGTCWVFPIEGFELEPGSLYEFGFLRGMQANNGITLVLAKNDKGDYTGYIQQTSSGLTSEEKARYNSEKDKEFEFISSWKKKDNDGGFTVNTVPMRFSVQTYADISKWKDASKNAHEFLDSVTDKDFREGKYKRRNIKNLTALLEEYDRTAKKEVRKMLQSAADRKMTSMIGELNAMLKKAKSDKPQPADMDKLEKTLDEAKKLYDKTSANVGNDVGQYGRIEVENLGEEIRKAEKLDKYNTQSEINSQVSALEDAMTEVRDSRVMKDQIPFYDKVTGIYVVAPADSLPENTKMIVRVMGRETDEYAAARKHLSKSEQEAKYYAMAFYDGDEKIDPDEAVRVEMPVADEIKEKTSRVYSVSSGGSLKRIETASANGTKIFKTEKLGDFVMAGSTASEADKAKKRSERMKKLMAQKKDKQADNKQNKLMKDKKKKEQFKDPVDKLLKRSAVNATFSNDVRRESSPSVLIFVAAAIAAIAVMLGIRGLIDRKRNGESDEI